MAEPKAITTKIRPADLKAAKKVLESLPLKQIDVLSAWRHLWEQASESDRLNALKKVPKAVA